MKIHGDHILFGSEDTKFIEKFGLAEAMEMVQNFKTFNDLPFIYDAFQLAHFLDVRAKTMFKMVRKGCNSLYTVHTVKKKNGGERQLCTPYPVLKYVQRIILKEILANLPVSKFATAYKSKIGIEHNALPHIGKKYILKMDITDFFGSITFDQVYSAAFNTKYFPKHIGVILTNFCCYNEVLPQGAPTSPALSNIVMKNFDDNLGRWCEKRSISYTRYCDDITFSSNKPLYNVFEKTVKMLDEMGFEVNEQKTHFVTSASRQSVTGLTVNQKLAVSKDYKRKLRQDIYYILKFGVKSHIAFNTEDFLTGDITDQSLHLLNSVLGKINYVLSVEKGKDNEYFKTAKGKILEMRRNLY